MNTTHNKKIHIVCLRFSSMGDLILQSPMISHIRYEYGQHCKITLVTAQEFAPLFQGHPHIDNVQFFSRKTSLTKLLKLIQEIHNDHPIDFIFDLHNTLRANFVKWWFWEIPKIAVDKRAIERKLLHQRFKVRLLKKQLITTRNIEDFNFLWHSDFSAKRLSKFLGKFHLEQGGITSLPSVFIGSSGEQTLRKFDLQVREYIVLTPSAAHPSKRWPAKRYQELALKIAQNQKSLKVVILAGPADDFCHIFDRLHPLVINLQARTSVQESTDIVGKARFCIGNDTGMIHIAEALLTPCIMIMGPTSEEFGFYPHLKKSYVFSHEMSCRPCSANGSKECFKKERYCLTQTSVDDVFHKLQGLLV